MSVQSPVNAQKFSSRFQAGLTLVELVVAIVIVAVGVSGILLTYNVAVRGSADPMMAKQALAIAEALLEEAQLAPFTFCDPDDPVAEFATVPGDCATQENIGLETGDSRPFDNVNDYDGLTLAPISDVSGTAIAGLAGYRAAVAVEPAILHDIPATGAALRITVTVTAPNNDIYTLEGYRARYAPNAVP